MSESCWILDWIPEIQLEEVLHQIWYKFPWTKGSIQECQSLKYTKPNQYNVKRFIWYFASKVWLVLNWEWIQIWEEDWIQIKQSESDFKNKADNKIFSEDSILLLFSRLPKPTHELDIDWYSFLFTDIIFDKRDNWRKYVIWYVNVDWKYTPRLFWFSNSWWNWHCSAALRDKDNGFLKWEDFWLSYEKWTAIDIRLSQYFQTFNTTEIGWGNIRALLSCSGYTEAWPYGPKRVKLFWESFSQIIKLADQKNQINFFDLVHSTPYILKPILTIEELIKIIWNINVDPRLDLSFNDWFTKWPEQLHKYLWKVEIIIWKTIFWNQPVELYFARTQDNPDLIWIEDIQFTNSPINSFWIKKEAINWWLLTNKPLQYIHHVPSCLAEYYKWEAIDDMYCDIRPFIQENPIIRAFKGRCKI